MPRGCTCLHLCNLSVFSAIADRLASGSLSSVPSSWFSSLLLHTLHPNLPVGSHCLALGDSVPGLASAPHCLLPLLPHSQDPGLKDADVYYAELDTSAMGCMQGPGTMEPGPGEVVEYATIQLSPP